MRKTVAAAAAILLLVADSALLFGQSPTPLTIGSAAARAFLFQGKPVHPFCVDFQADEEDAVQRLSACTAADAVPHMDKRGFLTADYKPDPGFNLRQPFSSYRVLSRKGNRFLIATTTSGGGTGIFYSLLWVHLDDSTLKMAGSIAGGDRCSGGLDDFHVRGNVVEFSQHLTPEDVLRLADAPIAQDSVEYSAISCFARAHFIYNLADEKLTLESVTFRYELGPQDGSGMVEDRDGWTGLFSAQSCFNKLFNDYIAQKRATLDQALLAQFGRDFNSRCGSPASAKRRS